MRAGKLRHTIDVYAPELAPDGLADTRLAYVPWETGINCRIEPLSGDEQYTANQVQAGLTHKITMRYLPGLTAQHAAIFEGRQFFFGPPLSSNELNQDMVVLAREVYDGNRINVAS